MPEGSSLMSQIYEPISLCLSPLSRFELDSCHLPLSLGEHIIIQGDTCLSCGPSGPSGCLVMPSTLTSCSLVIHASLLLDSELPGNKGCAFCALWSWRRLRSSIQLALKSWTLKSIRPGFESQLCHLLTARPWTRSLSLDFLNAHCEGSLERMREFLPP